MIQRFQVHGSGVSRNMTTGANRWIWRSRPRKTESLFSMSTGRYAMSTILLQWISLRYTIQIRMWLTIGKGHPS